MLERILHAMMQVYTPLKRVQEQVVYWIYTWIPYFLYEVSYCADDSTQVIPLYSLKRRIPWGKHRFGKLKGHFYIKYWNNSSQVPEELIMHSSLLTKAISMDSTEYIWAFSEEGFLSMLQSYIKEHQSLMMIDATLGTKNLYKENHSILKSLGIPNNKITPKLLGMFLKRTQTSEEEMEFVYYNDDVKEIRVKPTESIS